jgi:hypothetical protein
MKAIYKYRLPFMEKSKVVMHGGSTIIRVAGEDGAIWLWAIVDTDEVLVERTFHLYKTGGEMPSDIDKYTYHGCGAIFIQMELMMYVFENFGIGDPIVREPAPFDWKTVQETL